MRTLTRHADEMWYASVRVWQYDDPGDVRGVLIDDIDDNFTADGQRLR